MRMKLTWAVLLVFVPLCLGDDSGPKISIETGEMDKNITLTLVTKIDLTETLKKMEFDDDDSESNSGEDDDNSTTLATTDPSINTIRKERSVEKPYEDVLGETNDNLDTDKEGTSVAEKVVKPDLAAAETGIGGFGGGIGLGGGIGHGGGYGGYGQENYGHGIGQHKDIGGGFGAGGISGGYGDQKYGGKKAYDASNGFGGSKGVGHDVKYGSNQQGLHQQGKGVQKAYGNANREHVKLNKNQGYFIKDGQDRLHVDNVNKLNKKGHFGDSAHLSKAHKDDKSLYGNNHHAIKAAKGTKFASKGAHKKGHSTKGFRNTHHKDEFSKNHQFHDDNNQEDFFNKFGDEGAFHNDAKGTQFLNAEHANTFNKANKANDGSYLRGHNRDSHQGHDDSFANKGQHIQNSKYDDQAGQNFAKGYGKGLHAKNDYGDNHYHGFGKALGETNQHVHGGAIGGQHTGYGGGQVSDYNKHGGFGGHGGGVGYGGGRIGGGHGGFGGGHGGFGY